MKTTATVLATLALSTLAAGAQESGSGQETANASFLNMAGEENGSASLKQAAGGVLFELDLSGLPADQWVAFHVHETGECDPQTGYDSAGGHFNPAGADHGYLAENGAHAGDMPNQYVGSDGRLRANVFNAMVTLDGENGIRGKALMIHGGKDDYESQPSGAAGNRLACAVIE